MAQMKLQTKWMVAPTALLMALAIPAAAYSNPVQTPLGSTVTVNGNSSGATSGQCGFVPSNPTQVVQVTEAFTSLRFSVQGAGSPTLMVVGPNGRTQCVMADSFSQGSVEIPGVWEQGTYSVFVGDRNQGSHAYTLSITQEN
jgi:hypothetical protein